MGEVKKLVAELEYRIYKLKKDLKDTPVGDSDFLLGRMLEMKIALDNLVWLDKNFILKDDEK